MMDMYNATAAVNVQESHIPVENCALNRSKDSGSAITAWAAFSA